MVGTGRASLSLLPEGRTGTPSARNRTDVACVLSAANLPYRMRRKKILPAIVTQCIVSRKSTKIKKIIGNASKNGDTSVRTEKKV